MPTAPKRISNRKAKQQEQWWASRQNEGRKWYTSAAWKELRRQHLLKQPWCVHCVAEGVSTTQAVPQHPHVDHIRPHAWQWERFIDGSNLQTLCPRHHSMKTKAERAGVCRNDTGGS